MRPGATVSLWSLVGHLAWLAVVLGCGGRETPADRADGTAIDHPNVLLVTFCTLRADRLGAYGAEGLTPTMDGLAEEGLVFRSHYTQATYSGGSFASIVTGRYPMHHGVYDHPRRLSGDETTIGEVFQAAGYATGAFLTHRYLGAKWNYLQGFNVVSRFGETALSGFDSETAEPSGRHPEARIDAALEWVESLEEQPYLLWYQSQLSHYFPDAAPPYLAPENHRVALDFRQRTTGTPTGQLMFDFASLKPSGNELDALLVLHDAAVRRTDDLLGRLIDGLVNRGRFDNTIVVVTADHGEALGERQIYFNHDSNLIEPTVRVPLVIRGPGVGSREIEAVTRNIDLLPTLAELAAVDVPSDLDGTSLVPMIEGGVLDLAAYSETRPMVESRRSYPNYPLRLPGVEGKVRMIRRGAHKLVVYPGERYEIELFNLDSDPEEKIDIASERPELARTLATELERWFAGYQGADTGPLELEAEDLESLKALGYID